VSRRRLLATSVALLLLISPSTLLSDFVSVPAATANQSSNVNGPTQEGSSEVGAKAAAISSQTYVGYAIETANRVAKYQWDPVNSGYYTAMVQDWTSASDSSKQLSFKYWALAWYWLYDRTGNATYLSYANSYMKTLVDKAWSNGFYDSYTASWSSSTTAKSSAGNGLTLWELTVAYGRTGNKTYYSYAVRTANWIIDNLWDSANGCFWEDNTKVGVQTYVEGCSDAIIGLMSLYQTTGNQTYMGYVKKSVNFIISAWDNTYGGFYARIGSSGSCASVSNGCNKYPNENTWPIIALSYYYSITGNTTARSYSDRGVTYINSALWDWNTAYNGGLFRSLYQNNSIRLDTKTAWDNCGEPWMIWIASENVGGNLTYQTIARRILNFCVDYLHDSLYGGFFTEVDRSGATVTFSTKDAESISDSIASLSLVTPAPGPSASLPYLSLSVILANKVHHYMLDGGTDAYYYELSSNWRTILSPDYSTLGNAFITLGMIQLYQATGNETYLLWASSNANSFWNNAWDTVHEGFYDMYSSGWQSTTCVQTLQNNALFELDFLGLALNNGSSVWLKRATAVETLLNSRFWGGSTNVPEQSYNVCTGTQSGDAQIEVSIGSYLWATAEWAKYTSNSTYVTRMGDATSFAEKYLWDGSSNPLSGGAGSTGCGTAGGYLGFMRSAFADLSRLEDCRKGANENVWGALGIADLYNISGSASLLQDTNQDLDWVNSTFWDQTNGGYHETAFRNDTLRSACSSTNDPRDYPGWTNGEQPMLWWLIGQLTGNTADEKWAGVAEQWTAEHQWNYTSGNGGEMTCLDGNTLPDSAQANLYDWVQGSAIYTYSAVATSASSAPSVAQPVTVTVREGGAPSGTYTIVGCSPSPASGTTGTTTSFTMTASCSFKISFANGGGTRWGFISSSSFSGTSSSQLTCPSGTCSAVSVPADYQTDLTVNGGNGVYYSSPSETSDGWYKYGDSLTVSTNSIWERSGGTGTRLSSWSIDGGPSTSVVQATTFTTLPIPMTVAHTVNFNSRTQYQITVAAGTGGSATATTAPTISGDTGWYDAGTVVQVSATPNAGYTFTGWLGSGSGSYTGANSPAAVTMNGAITETASFSNGTGGGPLGLDGTATLGDYGSTSATASLTTTKSPDVIILLVTIYTGSSTVTVNSITSAHLTFTKRGSVNNAGHESIEEWYAVSTSALSGETIAVAFSGSAYATGTAFGVSGANSASPFDPSKGPTTSTGSAGTAPTITGFSTTNTNDMIISAYGAPGGPDSVAAGTGYSTIYHGHSPQNFGAEYLIVYSVQSSATVGFTHNTNYWAGIADAIAQASGGPTAVTQPLKVTFQNTYGGSTQTVTIGGTCSPSPSSFAGDGAVHSITMNPNCAFTLSLPAGYQATGGTGSTSCSSGNCAEYDTTYEQVPVTQPISATFISANGGSVQTLTVGGGCSPSPGTFAGDGSLHSITISPNCVFTLSVPGGYLIVNGGSSTSCASGTCSAYTLTTYEKSPTPVSQPVTISVPEAGAPAGTYTVNGCSPSPTTGVTGVTTAFTMTPSCSYTISFSGGSGARYGFITGGSFYAASSSQATCSAGTCTTASLSADYQLQLTVNGGNGVSYSLQSETSDGWYKYGDSLSVSTNSIWNRAGGAGTRLSSWNLNGGTSVSVAQTSTFTTSSISMTAPRTVNFVSMAQYQITVSATTGGTATATTAPTIPGDTGWYDSGTSAQISATASSGYTFSVWSGSGSGSYGGTNNPALVTMNSAVQETALFASNTGGGTLAMDGSVAFGVSGSTTVTAALTTSNSPDLVIVFVTVYQGSSPISVSGVTSPHLTFTRRASVVNTNFESLEEWYAIASSSVSGESIKITFSGSAYATGVAIAIAGANTASPFDVTHGSADTATGAAGTPPAMTGFSTSNPSDMVVSAYGAIGSSDSVTAGSGYAMVYHGHNPQNFGAEYQVVSSAQSSATVGFAHNTNYWAGIADAVAQAPGGAAPAMPQVTAALQGSKYEKGPIVISVKLAISMNPAASLFQFRRPLGEVTAWSRLIESRLEGFFSARSGR